MRDVVTPERGPVLGAISFRNAAGIQYEDGHRVEVLLAEKCEARRDDGLSLREGDCSHVKVLPRFVDDYINSPSGSPFNMILPTISKCASRDWICCDSVWISRNLRS